MTSPIHLSKKTTTRNRQGIEEGEGEEKQLKAIKQKMKAMMLMNTKMAEKRVKKNSMQQQQQQQQVSKQLTERKPGPPFHLKKRSQPQAGMPPCEKRRCEEICSTTLLGAP